MIAYTEYEARQQAKADKQWVRGLISQGVELDYDGMAIIVAASISDTKEHLISRQVYDSIVDQHNFRSMLKVGSDAGIGALANHGDGKSIVYDGSDRGMSRTFFVQRASDAIITQQIMVALYTELHYQWYKSKGFDVSVNRMAELISIADDITAAPLSADDRVAVRAYDDMYPAFEKSWIKIENKIRGYSPVVQKSIATMRYNTAIDKKSKRNKKGFVEFEMPENINENQTLIMGGLILDYLITAGIVNVTMSTRGGSSYEVVNFTKEFKVANEQDGMGVLASEVFVNELPPEVDADLQIAFTTSVVGNKVSITSNNEDRGDTSVMVKAMNHLQHTGLVVDEDAKARLKARKALINSI